VKSRFSQPVVIALIVVGFVVVGAGGWFTLIRPQHAKASDLDHQIADTSSAIDAARALTLEAKKGAQIRVADLYRLTKAMPDQVDMAGILLELNQVAEDSGITFEQITPAATATPISGYLAIPITVEFQATSTISRISSTGCGTWSTSVTARSTRPAVCSRSTRSTSPKRRRLPGSRRFARIW
jgi:Tfp pilus assembly protein PilO